MKRSWFAPPTRAEMMNVCSSLGLIPAVSTPVKFAFVFIPVVVNEAPVPGSQLISMLP